MRLRCSAVLLELAVFATCAIPILAQSKAPKTVRNAPALQTGDVPVGSLGLPIGTYVTLEGIRLDGMKTGVSTLRIETINGRKPSEPISIVVDDIELPKGQRCVLKGFESIRIAGLPPAWFEAEKERTGQEPPDPQSGWQVRCYFVPLSVVAPDGLKIRKWPWPRLGAPRADGFEEVKGSLTPER